jgi:aryl-alcohol dehydrogenase-like predicted oxidoreductase
VADRFAAFARDRGHDPAALAVAWAASHPAVTAPIVGARNTAQLAPLLAAVEIPMTPALRAEIAALSPEPAPATDRNEERTGNNFGVR